MAAVLRAGVVMTFCMLALVSPITMGDGVTWAAPLFFLLLFTLASWQQKRMKLCGSTCVRSQNFTIRRRQSMRPWIGF